MILRLGVILSVSLLFMISCQQDNGESSLPDKTDNNRFVQIENSEPSQRMNMKNREIADHLAEVAGSVPNVNDAAAIVAGPYAVVGINVDKDLDRSRVGTIKYSVSEAMYHDPYGKTAVVVADGDITERIRQMGNKIQEGHPVQGVVDELSAIVGRYMPEFPINEDQPVEPDQNKKMLPEDDEEKLDDIQNDQSNQYKNK